MIDVYKQITDVVTDATVDVMHQTLPSGVYRVTAKDQETLARIAAKSAEVTARHTKRES